VVLRASVGQAQWEGRGEPAVEAALEVMEAGAERMAAAMAPAPRVPIVSAAAGRVVRGNEMRSGRHWRAQALAEGDGLAGLLGMLAAEDGVEVVVELGPPLEREAGLGDGLAWIESLALTPAGERLFLKEAFGRAFASGVEVDEYVGDSETAPPVRLPGYHFERRRHWLRIERVHRLRCTSSFIFFGGGHLPPLPDFRPLFQTQTSFHFQREATTA